MEENVNLQNSDQNVLINGNCHTKFKFEIKRHVQILLKKYQSNNPTCIFILCNFCEDTSSLTLQKMTKNVENLSTSQELFKHKDKEGRISLCYLWSALLTNVRAVWSQSEAAHLAIRPWPCTMIFTYFFFSIKRNQRGVSLSFCWRKKCRKSWLEKCFVQI